MITNSKYLLWKTKPGRNSFENNRWDYTVVVKGKERCGMSKSAMRLAEHLEKNLNR